jgi:uncharacterized protein
MSEALIVFARIPRPGQVKTRLTSVLSGREAADLYEAFLLDSLDQYRALGVDVRLYLADPLHLAPDELRVFELFAQEGPDLGARMQQAFIETFGAGYARAVIIGTDHPTLPSEFIEMAFEALREPMSVSIGPSEDGGYYLLGLNDFFPDLFENMSFSHSHVFNRTLHRATRAAENVTVLPEWYDIDRPQDLLRLADEVDLMPQAARTRHIIRELHPRLKHVTNA